MIVIEPSKRTAHLRVPKVPRPIKSSNATRESLAYPEMPGFPDDFLTQTDQPASDPANRVLIRASG